MFPWYMYPFLNKDDVAPPLILSAQEQSAWLDETAEAFINMHKAPQIIVCMFQLGEPLRLF